MQRTKYVPEFKEEAVKQVTEKGHTVADVASRLVVAEELNHTWVGVSKQTADPSLRDFKAMQAETGCPGRQDTRTAWGSQYATAATT